MIDQTSNVSHEFNYTMWAQFLEEALPKESVYSKVIYAVYMLCIFTVSLIGNLLTCFVIYYDKSMHTATNYYLFNLAVSDLIVTLGLPLEVREVVSASNYGQLACQIYFVCLVCSWNNSILTITALSVERYFAIWHPLLFKSTPVWRRTTRIILLLWLIAILETVPEIFTVSNMKTQQSTICLTIPTALARIVNGVLAIVTFLIPLLIMTFVYSMIALKLNVTAKKNTGDQIFNYRNPKSKVNKLTIAMTLSFLICWLPFFAMRVMVSALDFQQLTHFAKWWGFGYKLTDINSWFSIAINPILFSLMSTKFRKALKSLWNTKVRNKHRLLPQRFIKRREAERAAVEAVERRMNEIIRIAMQEDDEIVGERNVLALELQNEVGSLNTYSELLATAQQESRNQLLEMLNLQTQLTNINVETVNLLATMQGLREQNLATLRADPVYTLIQEERELQHKLEEMGIYVYPPTGSDHDHPF